MREYVRVVGAVTLCVIWATVRNPSIYDSSGAFLKALGLNLKELSSGQRKGQLAITKRGSSGTSEHRKMKGLVALMRKLSRSLWHSHNRHEAFDYAKVFPGRPLENRKRRRRRPQVTGK